LISDLSELSIKDLISDANILFHVVANKLTLKVSVVASLVNFLFGFLLLSITLWLVFM